MSDWDRNSGPVACLRDGETREAPGTKAADTAASQMVLENMCAFATPEAFFTKE